MFLLNLKPMIKKVKNWGHCSDENWIELIEKEFSHHFNGTNFLNYYEFNVVKNIFNIPLNEKPLFLYS